MLWYYISNPCLPLLSGKTLYRRYPSISIFQEMTLLAFFGPSHPKIISLTVMAGLWIFVELWYFRWIGCLIFFSSCRQYVSKMSTRLFIVTIFVWSWFCRRFENNDSVIRAVSLACKIRVGLSTAKKIQMINCQSQGHYLVSKAHHHVSVRQKVHTPCHTNRTQ